MLKGCGIFTMLHIPPKMFVYYNFGEKWSITKYKTEDGIELKFKNCKLVKEKQDHKWFVQCAMACSRVGEWNQHIQKPIVTWKKK